MRDEVRKTIATARYLVGTKWRHLGRSVKGVDCLGLVILSLTAGGFEQKYDRKYGREPWKDGLRQALKDHFGEPITNPEEFQPGDIALLKWGREDQPSHVGILADYMYGGLSIIHAHSTIAVTEHRLDEKWRDLIIEVYRPWQ